MKYFYTACLLISAAFYQSAYSETESSFFTQVEPSSIAITITQAVTIPLTELEEALTPTFRGLAGNFPEKLYIIRNKLLEINKALQQHMIAPKFSKNRALMYGPPGNAKTSIVNEIAEETGCVVVSIDGPCIVRRYAGEGPKNVEALFKNAHACWEKYRRPVIIFIDEIDAIAANTDTEHRDEYKQSTQQLWLGLDKIKHDPRFFFICATNRKELIDKAFVSRFGGNVIELPKPDKPDRKDIIKLHVEKNADKPWDTSLINHATNKTDNFSGRDLESLVTESIEMAEYKNNGNVDKAIIDKTIKSISAKKSSGDHWYNPGAYKWFSSRKETTNTFVCAGAIVGTTAGAIALWPSICAGASTLGAKIAGTKIAICIKGYFTTKAAITTGTVITTTAISNNKKTEHAKQ